MAGTIPWSFSEVMIGGLAWQCPVQTSSPHLTCVGLYRRNPETWPRGKLAEVAVWRKEGRGSLLLCEALLSDSGSSNEALNFAFPPFHFHPHYHPPLYEKTQQTDRTNRQIIPNPFSLSLSNTQPQNLLSTVHCHTTHFLFRVLA